MELNIDKDVNWIRNNIDPEYIASIIPEIALIKNSELNEFLIKILGYIPERFFREPATSTGKFHPKWAKEKHGLLLHSRLVVQNALLLSNFFLFKGCDTDDIIISGVLHDSLKYSFNIRNPYTVWQHALKGYEFFIKFSKEVMGEKYEKRLMGIGSAILKHQGEYSTLSWNSKNYYCELPESNLEKIISLADFIASYSNSNLPTSNLDLLKDICKI